MENMPLCSLPSWRRLRSCAQSEKRSRADWHGLARLRPVKNTSGLHVVRHGVSLFSTSLRLLSAKHILSGQRVVESARGGGSVLHP